MAGLLDFFTGGGEYADPNALDPRYGVSKGDVRQAALNTLGNVSGLLLAAGQPMSGSQRAQILGQLGPAFGGAQTDIYNAAQRRLLGAENEQKMAQMQQMKSLADEMKDPAAFRTKYGFDPSGLPPQAVAEIITKQRTTAAMETPADRQMRDILSGGGGVSPTPPLSGGGVARLALSAGGGPTVENAAIMDKAAAMEEPQGAPMTLAQRYMAAGNVAMQAGRIEDANKLFDAAKKITPEAAKPRETATVGGILYERDPETGGWVKAIEPEPEKLKAEQTLSATSTIRKEFTSQPIVQNFIGAQSTFANMKDSADRANAGAPGTKPGVLDVALIKNFFLTMEPGLAVNQGEFGTIALAKSLDDRLTTALKAVDTGESLTPEIRNELVNVARQKVLSTYGAVKTLEDWYASIAEDAGIKPGNVKLDLRSPLVKKIIEEEQAAAEADRKALEQANTQGATNGAPLIAQIKATTDLQTLFDMGVNAETWDNATKAAYVARMRQITGVK